MDFVRLEIPGDRHSPRVRFIASPLYSLYQWVAGLSEPTALDEPRVVDAMRAMQAARFPRGRHGAWDDWERAIASAPTVDTAVHRLADQMMKSAAGVGRALELASPHFLSTVWPAGQGAFDEAVTTIERHFKSSAAAMVRAQADTLRLQFPDAVDVHLVIACYDRAGAYSHPATIDVVHIRGTDLCESVLHELTHVADVETAQHRMRSMKDDLRDALAPAGVRSEQAWQAWHAIIFAASGHQVRQFIHADHTDYAQRRGIYGRLGLGSLGELWSRYRAGAMTERSLFDALITELADA